MQVLEESEVLALLFPEPGANGKPSGQVMAVLQDAGGGLALHNVVPDSKLLRRARVAVRYKSGTPIVDPAYTRNHRLRTRSDRGRLTSRT